MTRGVTAIQRVETTVDGGGGGKVELRRQVLGIRPEGACCLCWLNGVLSVLGNSGLLVTGQ